VELGAEGALSFFGAWRIAAGIVIKMQIANSKRAEHRAESRRSMERFYLTKRPGEGLSERAAKT
jgi:hypothetical protein